MIGAPISASMGPPKAVPRRLFRQAPGTSGKSPRGQLVPQSWENFLRCGSRPRLALKRSRKSSIEPMSYLLNRLPGIVPRAIAHPVPRVGTATLEVGAARPRDAIIRVDDSVLPRPLKASSVLLALVGATVAGEVPRLRSSARHCRRDEDRGGQAADKLRHLSGSRDESGPRQCSRIVLRRHRHFCG